MVTKVKIRSTILLSQATISIFAREIQGLSQLYNGLKLFFFLKSPDNFKPNFQNIHDKYQLCFKDS